MTERLNTLSGLTAKRAEPIKYRDQLEGDIRAVTVDIDHREAAHRILDREDKPAPRKGSLHPVHPDMVQLPSQGARLR